MKNHQPKNPEEKSSKKEAKKASTFITKREAKKIGGGKYLVAHYQSGFQFTKLSFLVPYTGVENRSLL